MSDHTHLDHSSRSSVHMLYHHLSRRSCSIPLHFYFYISPLCILLSQTSLNTIFMLMTLNIYIHSIIPSPPALSYLTFLAELSPGWQKCSALKSSQSWVSPFSISQQLTEFNSKLEFCPLRFSVIQHSSSTHSLTSTCHSVNTLLFCQPFAASLISIGLGTFSPFLPVLFGESLGLQSSRVLKLAFYRQLDEASESNKTWPELSLKPQNVH